MVDSKELSTRNLVITFVVFLLLGFLTFFNSFQNKFLMDDYYFRSTPLYSEIQYTPLQWNPYREQEVGMYAQNSNQNIYFRPFAHVEISICYSMFKETYWKYHLFNLIVFVIAAFFLYLCIAQISKNLTLAFLASALYLVHPINGLVVNYITASCFAFQVIFMAGSTLLLFLSLDESNKSIHYYISLLFFTLALLCHESAVMTPFYIGAALIVIRNLKPKKIFYTLLPFLFIICIFIVFRLSFVQNHEHVLKNSNLSMNIYEYIGTNFILLIWYIGQLFYPSGITLAFVIPIIRSYLFWYNLGFFITLVIFILLFIKFRHYKIRLVALLWFLIGLSPCFIIILFLNHGGAWIEPHWFVFSVIGFFIIVASYFIRLLEKNSKWGVFVLCIVFFLLIQSSRSYNNLWRDEKTYSKYWLNLHPWNSYPADTLSHAYLLEKNYSEAEKLKLSQLAAYKDDPDLYRDLAVIVFDQGDMKKAEFYIKKAIELRAGSVEYYVKLVDIYFEEKDFISCEKYLLLASSLDPSNLDIAYRLIYLYAMKKDNKLKDLSLTYLNKANSSTSLVSFANLMAQNDLNELAYQAFQKALKINPEDKYVYLGIGAFLGNQGMYDEAIKMCNYGLRIDPNEIHFKEIIEKAMKLKEIKKNW